MTWQALGLLLTLLGLGVSALVWSRRGAASGLRAVAWSLLPLAAGLAGVLRLFGEIVDAVLRWATRLVFSPVVWLGLVVAGVSLLLFMVSGALARRRPRSPVTGQPAKAVGATGRPPARSSVAADEFADIEELLRRRGIS